VVVVVGQHDIGLRCGFSDRRENTRDVLCIELAFDAAAQLVDPGARRGCRGAIANGATRDSHQRHRPLGGAPISRRRSCGQVATRAGMREAAPIQLRERANDRASAEIPNMIIGGRQQRDRQVSQTIQHHRIGGMPEDTLTGRCPGLRAANCSL
jgi:hypothetical protein